MSFLFLRVPWAPWARPGAVGPGNLILSASAASPGNPASPAVQVSGGVRGGGAAAKENSWLDMIVGVMRRLQKKAAGWS